MRKIVLLLIFSAFQLYAEAGLKDSVLSAKAKKIIKAVQEKYAPDRTTEIFNTEINTSNPSLLSVETTIPKAVKELQEMFRKENIPVIIQPQLLPAEGLNGRQYGVINLSVSNNRTRPSHGAAMATQALLGTPVKILKKQDSYYLIRTPEGYISWIDNAGLTLMDSMQFTEWKAADKLVYTAQYGHAYQSRSKKAQPISDLTAGDILKLTGKKGRFYKAVFPDGRQAYILKKEAMPFGEWKSRPAPNGQKILETAESMLGVPYLWGGTSAKGVDCSGFTKMSYFLNGIILPRDASQQEAVGEKIDIYENDTVSLAKCLKNLQPGDLLFFAGNKNNLSAITHTAIYIGKGEFIQAAGLVRINSMIPGADNYDDYQSRTLVSAKRMLTAVGTSGISRVGEHLWYKQSYEH